MKTLFASLLLVAAFFFSFISPSGETAMSGKLINYKWILVPQKSTDITSFLYFEKTGRYAACLVDTEGPITAMWGNWEVKRNKLVLTVKDEDTKLVFTRKAQILTLSTDSLILKTDDNAILAYYKEQPLYRHSLEQFLSIVK